MIRKYLLFAAVIITAFSCTQHYKDAGDKMPNIIFIMADDLGYSDVGCYGQKEINTPNIDSLASQGMKFTQCYSGSSVCAPARSVLMTGKHTGHTTVRGNCGLGGVVGLAGKKGRISLNENDTTVAEILQDAGYVTGMVGKWGLGEPNTTGLPNDKGFDEFYGFLNQARAHTYYPEYIWKDTSKVELPGNKDEQQKEYTHGLFADYTLDFIDRNKDNPFFLYLPFCIPHDKYEIPELDELYKDKGWSEEEKTYASMISLMDRNIGLIMKKLRNLNIDNNTYVFFTSDNGVSGGGNFEVFNSSGPLRGAKRDAYDGGIRVPMIVRHPQKVKAGQTNDLVWCFADVLPTLAEIAKTSSCEGIDGISVLPTILGGKQDLSERYLYWEFYEGEGWITTRFGNWKAIKKNTHSDKPDAVELYNLKEDIGETNDLAEKYPEIVNNAEKIFKDAHKPSENFVWGKSIQRQVVK